MKKIIACVLTLCMLVSITAFGWNASVFAASAETAEETQAAAEQTAVAEPKAAVEEAAPAETEQVQAEEPTQAPQAEPVEAPQPVVEPKAEEPATDSGTADTGSDTGSDTGDADSGNSAGETTDGTADSTTEAPDTEAPTETAVATETAATDATATATATVTATTPATTAVATDATATETPVVEADVGSGPAWVIEGAHRHYGDLDELLPVAIVNSLTLYICSADVMTLYNYTVDELRAVSFGLDSDALGSDFCEGRTVIVSTISPSGASAQGAVYLWVGKASDIPTPEQVLGDQVEITTDDSELLEAEIRVEAADYTADAPCTPTFTLTAYPELTDGMAFAVSLNGGDAQPIDGNTFAPSVSGVYRFDVLDAQGTLKARSMEYTVDYGTQEEPAVTETESTEETPAADATETTTADATETVAPDATESATAEVTPEPTAVETPTLTQDDILQSVDLAATEDTAVPENPEVCVRAYNYVENALSDQTPSFELSGAPDSGNYSYGIAINGSDVVQLRGNTYAVTKSGDYTIVFYLLDSDAAVVSTSSQYHVIVDYSTAAADSEAWMYVGKVKLYGTLASLLRQADSGSTIYLLTSSVIALTDTSKIAAVKLAADPDAFGSEYGVVVSSNSPDGSKAAGTTYVWLGVDVDDSEQALLNSKASPTFSITSIAIGDRELSNGLWVNGKDALTFAITDTILSNTYTYEISTDGGVTYTAFSSGGNFGKQSMVNGNTYAVVFRVTDADDPANVVTTSPYSLKYDNQAPVLLCKAGTDNTLSFYAGDALSGFAAKENNVTFSASASAVSWIASLTLKGQNVYTYSVQYQGSGTIAAGSLGVKDRAGNIAVWAQDITISAGTGGGGDMSGGTTGGTTGSSGGGGTASRTVYHSASDYTTVTAYNGVELAVQTGTMSMLTIGDQQLDLTLQLDGSAPADGESAPTFMADFRDWKGGSATDTTDAVSDDVTVDTLVLTATDAELSADQSYSWTFDGSVYKKLAASGIDYLVLNVGDNVTALSTAGFAAGIRYNMYRASGLASKDFVYTVRMAKNADGSADTGSTSIEVTVNGQTYALTGDQTSEFYYYDIYCGTMDMLSKPFGQESVQGAAADGRQG